VRIAWISVVGLGSMLVAAAPEKPPVPSAARPTLLILGDSLGAGYGVDPDEAWPALIQQKLTGAHLPFQLVNASVSGDTTAGGMRRLDWQLKRPPEVLLIELGGNDGLRGLPPASTRSNLTAIITRTRAKKPDVLVVLAGLQMPANMGADYTAEFAALFPSVAEDQKVTLIPNLLANVGGVPDLNQPDLIHPTAIGHQLVASNVWTVLEPVLRRSLAPTP